MKYKRHTPEGFQDLLFKECYIKNNIETNLKNIFKSYGYFEIETPALEFYDVFAACNESINTETMFKFYDQQGRILVLRPDMTVPISRVAATKLEDNYPLRISYSGKTFRFRESNIGGQREVMQAGIELLGSLSPEADAEVIVIAINSLINIGIKSFQLDIGEVEFFKGLMEEGNFNEYEIEDIRSLIDKKDMLGVEQIIKKHEMSEDLREIIMNLPNYFGGIDVIEKVKGLKLNEHSLKALSYLEKVAEIINDYGLGKYVSIDLGMVQRLNYYTGVIFRGFTYGVGFPISSGGRYDGLAEGFGRKCPSVGFSIDINLVMAALERQGHVITEQKINVVVGYCEGARKTAVIVSKILRESGFIVEIDVDNMDFEKMKLYAQKMGIKKVIYIKTAEMAEIYMAESNKSIQMVISDILSEERVSWNI